MRKIANDPSGIPVSPDSELVRALYLGQIGKLVENLGYIRVMNRILITFFILSTEISNAAVSLLPPLLKSPRCHPNL